LSRLNLLRFALTGMLVAYLAPAALASKSVKPMLSGPVGDAMADTTAMDWGAVPEYRIVPGDLLVLNFGPQENLPTDLLRTQRVRPDGRITVFPVGDVVAAGRTPRELERVLVDLLAAELRAPRVTVEVSEIAGNLVHVMGRVKNPGSYPAGPFMTTLQAIARAGGFEDDASRNSVVVFHRNGARTVQVAQIRLDSAVKQGDLGADLPLSRFDIVYVPRSTIGNINVFSRQFFTEQQGVLNFMFTGWQLFNLDRVYPWNSVRVSTGTNTPNPVPPVPGGNGP
jgi:polysaccharide biosynthesis/export protein PslD